MKTLSTIALGLIFGLALAPHVDAAPQFGTGRQQNRDRVCVYKDVHYQGWEQCYNIGDEVASLDRYNNAISSIRIYGRARVTVYDETEFRGRSAEFASDTPDLGLRNLSGSRSWSDHIQSLRVGSEYGANSPRNNPPVYGGGGGYPPSNGNSGQRVNEGVCVYDRPGYQGREECWTAGSDFSDLARAGNWSDRISSIRVFGGAVAVLYRDIQFRGQSVTVDRDIPDLAQLSGNGFRSWDRQASSLSVEDGRNGFPGRGRGRARGRSWNWRQ